MAEWKQRLDWDPVAGVEASLIKEDGELVLHHRHYNFASLAAENRMLKTQPQKGMTKGNRLAARIPEKMYYMDWPVEFQMKHGAHPLRHAGPDRREVRKEWKKFVAKKVNLRENSDMRIDDGRKL